MAFELTDANFKENVLDKKGVVLVDFWAEWCGPCRMVGPIVDELATEFEGKALIGKVDVDTNPEVTMQYGVRSIPSIFIFKDGTLVDKHVGVATKQALTEKIEGQLAVAS